MKKRILIVAIIFVTTAAAVVSAHLLFFQEEEGRRILKVSGNIEVTESRMSFRIPGRLVERPVDEGISVQKGDLLARLDPTDREVAVRKAEANLEVAQSILEELEAGTRPEDLRRAKAQLERAQARLSELEHGSRPQEIAEAKAELERARAAVAGAQSQYEVAKTDEERFRRLYAERVVSAREYDDIRRRYETAASTLEEARARFQAARQAVSLREEGPRTEQIEQARAAVAEAEAARDLAVAGPRKEQIQQARARLQAATDALKEAQLQLKYTKLHAPFGGVILSKSAEPGEYLFPGSPVVTLGDLGHPWLRAYVNEPDLGRIRLGQEAAVFTDTYPDQSFPGRISFISSEAEFTPKTVQTFEERVKLMYRIKIDVPNPHGLLKPGMPANARIHLQ